MIISCVKWGDKYSHTHVNRLYKMVCKNFKHKFDFVCYTDNDKDIDPGIKVIPLNTKYRLETWWWKLCLFEKPTDKVNIFFDLDVVIQKDFSHFVDYATQDKLCMIKSYWKPYMSEVESEYDVDINSSIMIWKGDLTHIWNQFINDAEYYLFKYQGIDRYLYYDHPHTLTFLKKGEVYSRLYGINKYKYNRYGFRWKLYKTPHPVVCVFDGWMTGRNQMLDNEGYNGFEEYWN